MTGPTLRTGEGKAAAPASVTVPPGAVNCFELLATYQSFVSDLWSICSNGTIETVTVLSVATDCDCVAIDGDCPQSLLELTDGLLIVIDGLLTLTET